MRTALIAAIALSAIWLPTGCSTPATPGAVAIAPVPKEYTCDQQRLAGGELRALPPGAMLRRMVDDAYELRIRLRALHKIPEPACPPGTP
jgi:hypothetical protein